MIQISWAYYETLADLCELTENIAVATVEDIGIDVKTSETLPDCDVPFSETAVAYTVTISEPIKGGFSAGDTLTVYQSGWQLDDINIWHPDMPPLKVGKTYLLFFNEHINVPFESYPEISDGVLHPHERSRFFDDGMKADDAITMVTQLVSDEAAREYALSSFSADRGALDLSKRLSHITDQTPVRDLSEAEMQTVYDFAGDSRVIGTAGKLLKNGDIFIWVKTQELSRQQTEDLESALTPASEQAATARNWGYQVSITPYHSLIVIARGEDRATILEEFWQILDDLQE